jgi:hypothetical protein
MGVEIDGRGNRYDFLMPFRKASGCAIPKSKVDNTLVYTLVFDGCPKWSRISSKVARIDIRTLVTSGIANKKARIEMRALFSAVGLEAKLAFAELGTAAGTVQTVFLAFLHSGISRQEAVVSQGLEVGFIVTAQCTSDGHTNRTRLPS